MASKYDVENFLNILKAKMSIGDPPILFINSRDCNTQTLAQLEIFVKDQLEVLRALTVEDYAQGPLDDDKGRPLEWWVFGSKVKGKEMYIKISHNELNKSPICISFHIAKNKLTYPFNNK